MCSRVNLRHCFGPSYYILCFDFLYVRDFWLIIKISDSKVTTAGKSRVGLWQGLADLGKKTLKMADMKD
jgi:hypothetical protein